VFGTWRFAKGMCLDPRILAAETSLVEARLVNGLCYTKIGWLTLSVEFAFIVQRLCFWLVCALRYLKMLGEDDEGTWKQHTSSYVWSSEPRTMTQYLEGVCFFFLA
jgi:hypothetical protein